MDGNRPHITKKLKTPEDDYYPANVTTLSDKGVLEMIRQKLTPSQMEFLRGTCFGKLVDIEPGLKFSGNLLHSLLLRELETNRNNEMWFSVSGKEIRFSCIEFGLITGLTFDEIRNEGTYKLGNVDRLSETYFNGETVNRNLLKSTFNSLNFRDIPDEDAVKLALILILEGFLLGKDKRSPVNTFYMKLVDNLQEFNAYPWGVVTWRMTFSSLRNALDGRALLFKKRVSKKHKHEEEKYNLHGCPYVIQIWAYESIPLYGEKYGFLKPNLIPRILKWSTRKVTSYVEVNREVFSKENNPPWDKLRATSAERNELFYLKLQHYVHTIDVLCDIEAKVKATYESGGDTARAPHLPSSVMLAVGDKPSVVQVDEVIPGFESRYASRKENGYSRILKQERMVTPSSKELERDVSGEKNTIPLHENKHKQSYGVDMMTYTDGKSEPQPPVDKDQPSTYEDGNDDCHGEMPPESSDDSTAFAAVNRAAFSSHLPSDKVPMTTDFSAVREAFGAELKLQIDNVRNELRAEVNAIREEFRTEVNAVGKELRARVNAVKEDVHAITDMMVSLKKDIEAMRYSHQQQYYKDDTGGKTAMDVDPKDDSFAFITRANVKASTVAFNTDIRRELQSFMDKVRLQGAIVKDEVHSVKDDLTYVKAELSRQLRDITSILLDMNAKVNQSRE